MAGYDYTYIVKKKHRVETQKFLKYIKRIYSRYDIDSMFRTKVIDDTVEAYVYVDGRMAMLQLAERNLLREVINFVNVLNKNESYRREVIIPFLDGSREGIGHITDMVYDIKASLESIGGKAEVSDKILNTHLISELDDNESIASKYIAIVDNWYHESISNSQCVLLVDQFVEETNKHLLKDDNSARGYLEVLEDILSKGIIESELLDKLKYVHTLRNKTQHRGYDPNIDDVNYVINTGFSYMNLPVFLKGS